MYTLYHFPFSQHARRVVALLEAGNLPYRLQHVAMDKGEHHSPAYLAINPNHQVPTLIDGDLVLHESNAILRYLCAKHSLEAWYPSDPAHRASIDQWLDWNQCRLSPAVIDVVLNRVFLGSAGDQAAIARGEQRLAELAPILESSLLEEPFLTGASPTIADLSVASNITQLGLAGASPTAPAIVSWMARLADIPGVQKANQALQPQPA
jgi:glutathione S-transferase